MAKSQNTGSFEDIRGMRNIEGAKKVALVGSGIIYLLVVAYTEYHFFNLIREFVPGDFQIVGMMAVAASALTAILLPIALHFWFRSGSQKIAGFIFYALHWVIVTLNVVLNSHATSGDGLTPAFMQNIYAVWFLPAYIVLYGICWTIIWFLDDGSQEIDDTREVIAQERQNQTNRRLKVAKAKGEAINKAFDSTAAQHAINDWAARNAPSLLAAELGLTLDELAADHDRFEWWPDEEEQPQPQRNPRRTPPQPVPNGHTGD